MSFLKNFDFITVFSSPEAISPALSGCRNSLDSFISKSTTLTPNILRGRLLVLC